MARKRWEKQEHIPKWVSRYLKHACRTLNLGDYEFYFGCRKQPNPDNPDSSGTCEAFPDYLFAKLKFKANRVRKDDWAARVLIVHELLHVLHGEQDRAILETLPEIRGKRLRRFAEKRLTEANERFTVRMSRVLVGMIGDPPKK